MPETPKFYKQEQFMTDIAPISTTDQMLHNIFDMVSRLNENVNNYKLETSSSMSAEKEKMIQLKSEVAQLFKYREDDKGKFEKMEGEIKDNRHDVRNLETNVKYHDESISTLEEDLNLAMSDIRKSVSNIEKALAGTSNRSLGKKEWVTAFVTFTVALAGIGTIGAFVLKLLGE